MTPLSLRSKRELPQPIVVFLLLLGPFFAATIALCAPPRPLAVTNTMPLVGVTLLAATNSEEEIGFTVPVMCSSTNKLASYCRRKGIPIDIAQVQVQTNSLLFVLTYPYSGINNAGLACYAWVGDRWIQFLGTGVWGTPPASVRFIPEGDFVNVLRNGKAILKIRPPN